MSEAPPGPQDPAPEPPESAEPARSTDRASRADHNPQRLALLTEDLGSAPPERPGAGRLLESRLAPPFYRRGEVLTPDLGGSATTGRVTDAVIAAIGGANA